MENSEETQNSAETQNEFKHDSIVPEFTTLHQAIAQHLQLCVGLEPSLALPAMPEMEQLEEREFGGALRDLFFLKKAHAMLNHGSFGAVPRMVHSVQNTLMIQCEQHPDQWFRYDDLPLTEAAIEPLAKYLGCKSEDVVFVPNATTGVNSVLTSLLPSLKEGDVLLAPDTTYRAVQLTLQRTAELSRGAKYQEFSWTYPFHGPQDVIEQFRTALDQHPKTKFVMLDHIISPTAMILPVKELCALCHERGIIVMIDGAHAAGQIKNLKISEVGADYYTANLHKWLFAPKGSAVLWAAKPRQATLHPVLVSHNAYDPSFRMRFFQQGTRNDTSYLSSPYGLAFLQSLGEQRCHVYQKELLKWAVDLLENSWSTSQYRLCPLTMHGYMAIVALPDALQIGASPLPTSTSEQKIAEPVFHEEVRKEDDVKKRRQDRCSELMKQLSQEYGITVAITVCADRIYARISSHVYNHREEYTRLDKAIRTLATQANETEPVTSQA